MIFTKLNFVFNIDDECGPGFILGRVSRFNPDDCTGASEGSFLLISKILVDSPGRRLQLSTYAFGMYGYHSQSLQSCAVGLLVSSHLIVNNIL